MDRNKDRLHPKKKNRPIASGAISVSSAIKFAVILFSISLIINFICAKSTIIVWGIYAAYFIVNLLYSVAGMKKIPLIDVALLVAGFFIRVYYGAAIIYIPISGWLYLVIITGAFYLGFGKRRNELQKYERRVIQKEESLDRKQQSIESKESNLNQKLRAVDEKQKEVE